jgi:HK97 family phage major capsid protein
VTSDKGNEVRSLRFDESIAGAIPSQPLPDGIRANELSPGRFVKAAVTGNWREAEAEKRAMSGAVDSLGGYLVPSRLAADIIDLARNQAVVLQAGGVTAPMLSNSLVIAKLTNDVTAGWKVENVPQAPGFVQRENNLHRHGNDQHADVGILHFLG